MTLVEERPAGRLTIGPLAIYATGMLAAWLAGRPGSDGLRPRGPRG